MGSDCGSGRSAAGALALPSSCTGRPTCPVAGAAMAAVGAAGFLAQPSAATSARVAKRLPPKGEKRKERAGDIV